MGLDITAYKGISFAEKESDDTFEIYANPDFPKQAADLPTPCHCSGSEDSMGFRAGSYSGYNSWREKLAHLAGYALSGGGPRGQSYAAGAWDASAGPFWELINFSDCEGAIGPAVCAKLHGDFLQWRAKAAAFSAQDPNQAYFMELYDSWTQAVEFGAQDGAVCLH